jgi:hypothetical protein
MTGRHLAAALLLLLPLLLPACTYYRDPSQEEATIVAPGNFKAGSGEIYQVGVLPDKGCRLYLRMDRTGTQSVDVDKCNFFAGGVVDLTNDGRVVRVSGTSLNDAASRSR